MSHYLCIRLLFTAVWTCITLIQIYIYNIYNNGVLLDTVEDMTSSLNDYFATVFTTEDTSDIPIPTTSGVPIDHLQDVQFSEEDVRLLLSGLRGDKAGGADELSPRLLLELRDYVATPLYLMFRKGLD